MLMRINHNLEQKPWADGTLHANSSRLSDPENCKGLNPKDRWCYFLSGSYGNWKMTSIAHVANYFASPTDVPELEAFFKNYDTAQKMCFSPRRNTKRTNRYINKQVRSSGKFLVAICRFVLNLDFEGALLRALEEVLKQDDSKLIIDSHYSEALRRIKDWQERRNESRFFNELELELGRSHSDWTFDDLIKGLQDF